MNKLFIGKINLSKIDKTRLFTGQKGIYLDVAVWFSEEPDKFGNNLSIQQSTKKDEPKIYIGEAKFYVPKEEPAKDKQGEWQGGKKEVKSMSNIKDLPGAEENLDSLPF
jgi:hypothetical protein